MSTEVNETEKIELRRFEPFCAGITLIIAVTFAIISGSLRIPDLELDIKDYDNDSDLEDLHNKLKNDKNEIMVSCAFYWFQLPLFVLHIFFISRVFNSWLYLYDINVNFPFTKAFIRIYTVVIIIIIVIYSCLDPCILMVTVYFNWEFTDIDGNTSYTGYYIQYQLIHILTLLDDSSALAIGIVSNIPWFFLLLVTSFFKSRTDEQELKRNEMSNHLICFYKQCSKSLCTTIMIGWMLFMITITLMCLFSWNKNGWWSYYGGSQQLNDFVVLSQLALALWLIYIGCKFNTLKNHINDWKQYQIIQDKDTHDNDIHGNGQV